MSAPLKVTVTDAETGEILGEQTCVPGDYVLIAAAPCYRADVQAYPTKGTHVVTIKGHAPQKPGGKAADRG